MTRVRLHGRGGQGMKTAGRILGSAALREGLTAQDAPVYGAERRGAPMMAFVRIARGPIVERGPIAVPDLVVVADDTLLDDPAARPLAGLAPDGALLLATAQDAPTVRARTGHPGPLVARDFLALALEATGSPAALSTALAAAACALLGLGESATLAAVVEEELAELGVPADTRARNRALATGARAGLAPLPPRPIPAAPAPLPALVEVAYAPPEVGAPTVAAPANTPLRRTGHWRVFRPVIDLGRCTRCWICFVFCPEGAIALEPDDTPRVDYEVCKGCLICAEECPIHCIDRVREVRAWAAPEGPR